MINLSALFERHPGDLVLVGRLLLLTVTPERQDGNET
jgi:hypothetical protein